MSIQIILLLSVLAGAILFALQNLSPVVPLVMLGGQTLALPLAVWVLGAIAAGAMTTLVIAGLFRLSAPAKASYRRPSASPAADYYDASASSGPSWSPPAWTPPWKNFSPEPVVDAEVVSASNNFGQSWEDQGRSREDWEDWEGYEAPSDAPAETPFAEPFEQPVASPTELRDTLDQDWADWEGYEDLTPDVLEDDLEDGEYGNKYSSEYRDTNYLDDEFEDSEDEDWDDEPQDRAQPVEPPSRPVPPSEVWREPKTQFQSGSLYSYSYRDPSDSGVGKTESVYNKPSAQDAEYRVLTPPYRPPAEETAADDDLGRDGPKDLEDYGPDDDDLEDYGPEDYGPDDDDLEDYGPEDNLESDGSASADDVEDQPQSVVASEASMADEPGPAPQPDAGGDSSGESSSESDPGDEPARP